MPSFRYELEQNLIIGCSAIGMFPPSALADGEFDEGVSAAHIYIVASRPRLVCHEVQSDGSTVVIGPHDNPCLRLPLGHLTASSKHGGQGLEVYDGKVVAFDGRPSQILQYAVQAGRARGEGLAEVLRDFLDLNVLYVGKSDDPDGVVRRRLKAHSTLQRIIAKYADEHPELEIWILACVFNVTNTVGVLTSGSEEGGESIASRLAAQQPDLSSEVLTALAEGALIRYFEPPFNQQLKQTFPSRDHSSYLEAISFDYNSYGFHINTDSVLAVWLGSEVIAKAPWHEPTFAIDPASARIPLTMENLIKHGVSKRQDVDSSPSPPSPS